jgi:hypothetical protein
MTIIIVNTFEVIKIYKYYNLIIQLFCFNKVCIENIDIGLDAHVLKASIAGV